VKRVLLLRHAKSSWSDPELPDRKRPLARRGVRDAKRLARSFARAPLDFDLDLVLCSPATRARQTWEIVGRKLAPAQGTRIVPELYMPTRDGVLDVLRELPDDVNNVLLVGHNPAFEAVALALARHGEPELVHRVAEKFPTACLCVLALDIESFRAIAEAEARLERFVTPRELGDDPAPRAPRKGKEVELTSTPRLRESALRVLDETSAQLRENAEGVRLGEDPEYVHQMRVGVRRLRTALAFFEPALDAGRVERLQGELAWLFRALGPLREYDVFLRDMVGPSSGRGAAGRFRGQLQEERAALLSDALTTMASARFADLLRELLAYEAELAHERGRSPKLRPFAARRLNKRLKKITRLEAVIEQGDASASRSPADPRASTLHALRKQLKKLRYASEFVRAAFPERATRHYLKRLAALQDVLGQLNDVAVGERLLAAGLKNIAGRAERQRLREQVRTRLDAAALSAGLEFEHAWRNFEDATPFWR
jgi:phosphohistidine phosphatase